ncbi:MAG: hypothetical protein JWM85_1371 [Acidimicrobiaceae bacterium]|nr:hypothetical protein [Acidimicrobiaceae bacterium]
MSSDHPAFESPAFPEPEDDLDELDEEGSGDADLDDDDLDDDEDNDDGELEQEDVADVADSPNRASGGIAHSVLEHVARSIVDEPEAVAIEVQPGRGGVVLSLRVAPGDMGRVIGKRGRVAQAMRTVVRAAAAREGADATVDIVD